MGILVVVPLLLQYPKALLLSCRSYSHPRYVTLSVHQLIFYLILQPQNLIRCLCIEIALIYINNHITLNHYFLRANPSAVIFINPIGLCSSHYLPLVLGQRKALSSITLEKKLIAKSNTDLQHQTRLYLYLPSVR